MKQRVNTTVENTEFNFKKLEMFEQLIDDRIDCFGVRNTIAYLVDNEFTKEELLEMNFDQEDVDYVFENPDEVYDYE